jgi:hypothetical protein
LLAQCKTLIDAINSKVYELYGKEPSTEELSGNWSHLLQEIKQKGWVYDIFTTNYDVAIETALSIDKSLNTDRFLGLKNIHNKQLDIKRWENPSENEGLLTKLHGSVNWQWGPTKEDIYVSAPVFTGLHENHAIIYPGFKGESQLAFFSPMHNYFSEKLSKSHLIIFIGFAFRDEYINNILAENIDQNTKIAVIDPCKKINFPIRRRKPMHISGVFNKNSIDSAFSIKLPKIILKI